MPSPRSVSVSPGCVPAGISSSVAPSSVGTVSVVPSAAQRRRHVDDRDEVVAVAHEALVLAHAHEHVEVARRAAALARVAAAGEADPLAVVDPGRDVDLERAAADRASAPAALGARLARRCCPSPPQTSHTVARTIWPNGVAAHRLQLAGAPQRAQVSIGVPGSAPLPWQCSQRATAS